MSLRWITLAIVVLSVVALSAVTYGVASRLVDHRFSGLEEQYARRDVDRAVNAVAAETDHIDALEADWSAWDDTYAFMETQSQAYLDSNVTPNILDALQVDLFAFVDPAGKAVMLRANAASAEVQLADVLRAAGLERLPSGAALDGLALRGVVATAPVPTLVAVRPILTSEGSGPARGVVVMARYLDAQRLASLGETARLSLSLPAAADTPPLGHDGYAQVAVDGSRLAAFGLLSAPPGLPAVPVRVDVQRDIAEEGADLTRDVNLTILGTGVVLTVVIFALFEGTVLRRMRRLSVALRHVGTSGDMSARVPASGRDEVGQLSRDINGMLAGLQHSEGRYRQLVASAADGIFIVRDGEIAFTNDAGARLLGARRPELVQGQRLDGYFAAADREAVSRALQAGHVPQSSLRGRIVRPGGEERVAELNVTGLEGDSEGGVQVIARDLTDRAREEEERRALDRRVEEMQRLESLGLLAGGIAHDFNNLMMGVMGNASLARIHAGEPAMVEEALTEIERATSRASDLTRQLLAYAGRGKLMVTEVDLSALVQEMSGMMRAVLTRSAELDVQAPTGLPLVEADATQLRQVVLNLLTNASDAIGDQRGLIRVRTGVEHFDEAALAGVLAGDEARPGDYVFVEVSDNGPGIMPELQSRIFDPFFSTKGPGRGLGLGAVLGIVRAHGGAIDLRSAPGHGTTFRVLFPASDAPAPRTAPTAPASRSSGGRLLVVDDEPTLRRLFRALLEEHGFSVLTANNGRECLDVLGEDGHGVDGVILDLTMPGMDGHEALRRLRQRFPRLPVVIVSGHSSEALAPEVAQDPFTRFLQKPFAPPSILALLGELLDQAPDPTLAGPGA